MTLPKTNEEWMEFHKKRGLSFMLKESKGFYMCILCKDGNPHTTGVSSKSLDAAITHCRSRFQTKNLAAWVDSLAAALQQKANKDAVKSILNNDSNSNTNGSNANL